MLSGTLLQLLSELNRPTNPLYGIAASGCSEFEVEFVRQPGCTRWGRFGWNELHLLYGYLTLLAGAERPCKHLFSRHVDHKDALKLEYLLPELVPFLDRLGWQDSI